MTLKLRYTPPQKKNKKKWWFSNGKSSISRGPHFQGRTISFKGGYWSWSHDMMLDGQGGEVETNYSRWMVETDVFLFKSDIRSWVFSKWNLSFKAGKIKWDSFFFGDKTMQMYCNFRRFPCNTGIVRCLGWDKEGITAKYLKATMVLWNRCKKDVLYTSENQLVCCCCR